MLTLNLTINPWKEADQALLHGFMGFPVDFIQDGVNADVVNFDF